MKAFLYMALVVAFIVIFQQNPLFGVILIAFLGGGYLYFKSRKNGGRMGLMRSGRMPVVKDQTQILLTYMLLQQLSTNNNTNSSHNLLERKDDQEDLINEHQRARDELLQLLK